MINSNLAKFRTRLYQTTSQICSFSALRWQWLNDFKGICFALRYLLRRYIDFYDRMTVQRNRFVVNKTNRRTEIQFYWYYDSACFGQPFCPSSGVLGRTSVLVHFMQFWWPRATRSRMELRSILLLVANGHQNCIKCTKANIQLRTPDGRQKGCPKHVES